MRIRSNLGLVLDKVQFGLVPDPVPFEPGSGSNLMLESAPKLKYLIIN